MALNVWFVPSNSSHTKKNRLLLDRLHAAGCQVCILCLDDVQDGIHSTREQAAATGYPVVDFPRGGFRPCRHWLGEALQRHGLARTARALVKSHSVDVMVFGADTAVVSRTIGRVARECGVFTVLIMDGLVLPSNPACGQGLVSAARRAAGAAVQRLLYHGGPSGTSGADLVLAMSETARQVLIGRGVPPERVRVVGSPEYDELARRAQQEDFLAAGQRVRQRLGIDPRRAVLFFAHQDTMPLEAQRQLVLDMVQAARPCGAAVLVKFHPRGDQWPAEWQPWAAAQGLAPADVVFTRDECTSIEAVQACQACVTVFSTVSLEAMICGKPLVVVQYADAPEMLTYADQYGAAMDARSAVELKAAIVAVLTRPQERQRLLGNAQTALQHELCGPDGKSADRIVGAILQAPCRHSAGVARDPRNPKCSAKPTN